MDKQVLIDLTKFRVPFDGHVPEGYVPVGMNGLKTIRELAVFRFVCRRCTDAPCIAVCPADALEKDTEGMITRATNLCVSCKSCVTICPFGTMMSDFFIHHHYKESYFDLSDENELLKFRESCPDGAVELVEMDEDPEKHIYRLNEQILIKDFPWDPATL